MFRARWLRPFACLAVALMLAASARAADSGAYDQGAMMRAVVENWLASQQADGLLPYGFDFLTGQVNQDTTSSGFIAREAGAIWVWARYYSLVRDARYVEPLRRALDALVARSIRFGKPAAQRVLDALRVYEVPFGRITLARALQNAGPFVGGHRRHGNVRVPVPAQQVHQAKVVGGHGAR